MMSVPVIWFIVGVGCMLLELASPLFIIFFFGLGAWAASFAMYLGASLAVSFGVFSVVSVASLLILRRVFIKTLHSSKQLDKDVSTHSSIYVGKQAVVSKAILPDCIGEISLGGSYWRALLSENASSVPAANDLEASSVAATDVPSALGEGATKELEIGRVVVVIGHDPDDAILLHVRPV